jgi:hypothetical protein
LDTINLGLNFGETEDVLYHSGKYDANNALVARLSAATGTVQWVYGFACETDSYSTSHKVIDAQHSVLVVASGWPITFRYAVFQISNGLVSQA